MPRHVEAGAEVISGCINMTGLLRVRTTRLFGTSTVSRILELVENASEKKAKTENFITRFARVYTPAVTFAALAIAVIPPLLGMGAWADWIMRGLTFLVVSCPCALVISVPLSFFGGIGGASRLGILVKGSNYLEALSRVRHRGIRQDRHPYLRHLQRRVAIHPEESIDPDYLLDLAAHAEAFSDHPIAVSVKAAYSGKIDQARGQGHRGIRPRRLRPGGRARGHGGQRQTHGGARIKPHDCELTGTILHVSVDGRYIGHIVIADVVKDDAKQAIRDLHAAGVERCIMLTDATRTVRGRSRQAAWPGRVPCAAAPRR